MPNELDKDAVNLAKAIRLTESGDKEDAKGASGEFGLYQFMPKTWASTTQKYNLDPNDKSRQNQNKAAYLQIKELKDQGYKPSQIAAFWNSGKTEGWENNVGVNEYGVKYDTPSYVRKVGEAYNQVKGAAPIMGSAGVAQAGGVPGLPPPPTHTSLQGQGEATPQKEEPWYNKVTKFMGLDKTADTIGTILAKAGAGENAKYIEAPTGKEVLGAGLNIGSFLVGGGGAFQAAKTGFKAGVLPLMKEAAKQGFKSGGMFGAGQALEENKGLGDVTKESAVAAGIGGVTAGLLSPLFPLSGKMVGKAKNLATDVKNAVTSPEDFAKQKIQEDVSEILGNGRVMTNATQKMTDRNIPIAEMLSDPEIFKGIQVSDNKMVVDEAVATIDDRIEAYMRAKRAMLPELDRITMPVSKEIVRQEAKRALQGSMSPLDEAQAFKAIDRQVDALSDNLTMSQLDDLRARFRKSARNARGLQKSDSEYSALENATRDILFKQTDNLPFDTNREFPLLNDEIKKLIGTQEFLDKVLRGRNAPRAGWGREMTARLVGGMAGASAHGPIGTLVGSHIGGQLTSILSNQRLGNSLKMKLIRNLTKDKKVIEAAESFLKKAKGYDPLKEKLALPAPAIRLPGPNKLEAKAVSAPKGEPGRTPKGKLGAGQYFRTYRSSPAAVGGLAGVEEGENDQTQVDPLKAALGIGAAGLLSRKLNPKNLNIAADELRHAYQNMSRMREIAMKEGGYGPNHSIIKRYDKELGKIQEALTKSFKTKETTRGIVLSPKEKEKHLDKLLKNWTSLEDGERLPEPTPEILSLNLPKPKKPITLYRGIVPGEKLDDRFSSWTSVKEVAQDHAEVNGGKVVKQTFSPDEILVSLTDLPPNLKKKYQVLEDEEEFIIKPLKRHTK